MKQTDYVPGEAHAFETWRKVGGSASENESDFTYPATSATMSGKDIRKYNLAALIINNIK